MSWQAPDEGWPQHSRKEAEKALQEARELGWSFRKGGHFGTIRCPFKEHENGGCRLVISSTSGDKSGTATAKIIRRKLRSCRNLGGPEPTSSPTAIANANERVAHLVGSAELLRASDLHRAQAEEILDKVEDVIPEVQNRALEQALQLDDNADQLEAQAWQQALAEEAGDPWPPGEGAWEIATAASGQLDAILAAVDVSALDSDVQDRIADIRGRLAEFGV